MATDPKLIICVDGLGKDLVSEKNTPFLYDFGEKNYCSELETLFAFTGIEYSFFSGKTPRENNIWVEFIKSEDSIFNNWILKILPKKIRDYFAGILQVSAKRTWISGLHNIPKNKLKYFDTSVERGIWELDFFHRKKFAVYKWPIFAMDNKRKLIFKYENDENRLRRLSRIKEKEVYYVQLMGVDKAIHKFGKKNQKTKKALKKIDCLIRKYVEKFLNENKNGKVFLWSDHGFADIKNYIDLRDLLPMRKDYLFFIAGTTAHFWFKNDEIKEKIFERFKKIKGVSVLDERTAKKLQVPSSKKYGEVIFYIKKGNYFFPNFYQKSEKEKFKAMHGYPDDKELNGFLISNKEIPKKIKIDKMSEVLNG